MLWIHSLLSTLCPPLSVKLLNFDFRLFQHQRRQGVRIAIFIYHPLNSCVNDHLRANHTRVVRTVKGGSLDRYSMVGGLDDRVLLGMKAPAELMSFSGRNPLSLAEAPDIQAVFQTGRRAVVTRGQNLFVFDEDGPHLSSNARGPFRDEVSNIHEIFFPGRSMRRTLFFLFLFQR